MPPKKKVSDAEPVALATTGAARPRLHKLIISNFRSIGAAPVEIELDDIVVLVGPNNAGKSSVLRAYEIVMLHGSKDGRLAIDDFPGGIVNSKKLPQVELQTVVFDKAPGDRWIKETPEKEWLIVSHGHGAAQMWTRCVKDMTSLRAIGMIKFHGERQISPTRGARARTGLTHLHHLMLRRQR